MKKLASRLKNTVKYSFFYLFLLFFLSQSLQAQISFSQSNLDFNGNSGVSAVTGMSFGPDDRLYIVEYPGFIKIYTIQRNSSTDYIVTAVEQLNDITTIQDHNDDGTDFTSTFRETIGIAVGGTAVNPVFYVSSSDFRIGAGSGGGNGDIGLDTNSGIITRFSWNGTSWDVVDIVRGLPRSEENHATNGLELATINGTNYLIAASGGHTNGGAPSTNFVYTCEYALSGAVLAIDLDMLDAMPILNDNGRNYIYDIPTLDDPTRPNVNGITDPDNPAYTGEDINDPFGGNDGLNMAIVVPNGPVQILAPGYRNAYDLVVTENGALYVTDNGANQGWGGFPENEGGGSVTNDYNSAQPGNTSSSGGEYINNLDHLQLVTTDLNTYTFNSEYGGHPNPVRGNPSGAGLYTDNTSSLGTFGSPIWRTSIYDPDGSTPGSTTNPNEGLPANWPPVQIANPVEGDWRGPGINNPDGPNDNPVVVWGTNTNGIAEYTASNFNNALKGNLLAGHNGGNIRRVILSQNGTSGTLEPNFFSGIGGNALGITCNGDNDIFPGTVWAGTLNGIIVVMEPQDTVVCIQPGEPNYNPLADYDNDGYTNQDEEDNGTDPCNGGSQPTDFDKLAGGTLISDRNDTDDDNDGIIDAIDTMQLGNPLTSGSDAFTIPIANDLFNDQQGLGGIFGLGMTGLMNNGDTGLNWLNWLDRKDDPSDPNPNDVLGGAPGIMTSHMTSGTALGTTNNQEKAYQYGVQVDSNSDSFTVIGGMNGFSGGQYRLYDNTSALDGELGFFIGDGTQSNYIKFVVTTDGFTILQEINDIPQTPINFTLPVNQRPSTGIRFYFKINPLTGNIIFDYKIDSNPRITIGNITAQGEVLNAIQQSSKDLIVGFIGTSGVSGIELEGSWDFLNVLGSQPIISSQLPNINRLVNAAPESINLNLYFNDDGGADELTYTIQNNTDPSIGAIINGNILDLSFPATPAISNITIRATDVDNNFIEQNFDINVTNEPFVLYRVNTGGPEINAIDGGINWLEDTQNNNSIYLQESGSNTTYNGGPINSTDSSVDTNKVPVQIFDNERYDANSGIPNLEYNFPVSSNGNYEVRLFMGNSYSGTSNSGERVFNVNIEGNIYPELADVDLSGTYGHQVGTMISYIVPVNDGIINIEFLHNVENPLVNGIEILEASPTDTPIYAYEINNQSNLSGEMLNGSLGVVALGGDGNLQYSATGLPPGVFIEPTNGQIGGTININAAANSPYTVEIIIDDSDSISSDSISIQFTWTVTSSLSNFWFDKNEDETYTARHECSFVQAGDKFYLFGGRENAQTLDVYNYATNSWTSLTNSAPFEFNHFQAIEYQGLIWVIGAFKTNTFPNETPADYIWTFNPASQEWIQGPEIPTSRKRGSTGLVIHNNKFYILGGNTSGHDGGYVNWFDEYDPATGIWTQLIDAPRARDHFHAAIINNKLYAASGRLSGGSGGVFAPLVSEVDVYDFSTQTWSTLPSSLDIPTPRAGAIVASFEDKLIVSGGESLASTDAYDITEIYDPISENWSVGAPLNHKRHGTQGIVSGNGIFITAGSPNLGGGNQKNMEFYGQDNPQGTPSIASILTSDNTITFGVGQTKNISISNGTGNTGTILKSMTITGSNASDFIINSGNDPYKLIPANSYHDVTISHVGISSGSNAILTIVYNNSDTLIINLNAPFDGLIYDGTSWYPNAPNNTTSSENALIIAGLYSINSNVELNNLNIQTGATLSINAGNSLLINGNLNNQGTLELNSTSSTYSSLIANGTVTGNAIYKRHVNVTSPQGQANSNDLISAPVSGEAFNIFATNNSNIVSNNSNTLYLFGPFNKTNGTYDIYSNTETATLNPGVGYRTASTDAGTFTFNGAVNTGSVSVPIVNSGPAFQIWNLVGNPYPSYISLVEFLNTNNSEFDITSAGVYGYDGYAGDGWTVWNQAYADLNPNTLIAPGQGFFVTSQSSGGTITFNPSMRAIGQSDDFILGRSSTPINHIKLNLSQNTKNYSTDFYFSPNASRGLDKGYDAQIMGGNAPNFSIYSYLVEENTGLPMVIQSLEENDYNDVLIPLGINASVGQQLTISISENTLPDTVEVYLEDQLTQNVVQLNNSDHTFLVNTATNTLGRFYLRFTDTALSTETSILNKLNVFNDFQNQAIVISGIINEATTAKLYDVQGRQVFSNRLKTNTITQSITVNDLQKGVYIISIENASEKTTKKLIIR